MKYYLTDWGCGSECCCIKYYIVDENKKRVWESVWTSNDMMEDERFLESLKEGVAKFNPEIDEYDQETFKDVLTKPA